MCVIIRSIKRGDTTTLSEKFYDNPKFLDIHDFFNSIIKSSEILRQIHRNGIICQDLSFENILIDSNEECYFIDFDACSYGGIKTLFISKILNEFFGKYRKERIEIIPNLDRISMIISFFNIIFGKPIYYISKFEYKRMAKYINTLNKLEPYVEILLNKKKEISYIPYLDEEIDNNDDYLIKIKK